MEKSEVKVLWEDGDLMVVDKPANLVTTSENSNTVYSLQNWLEKNYPDLKILPRAGIVHRLDKGTSGVLIVAKNLESLLKLKMQFKNRQVFKTYWALVAGKVGERGEVETPIERSPIFGKWRVGIGGKKATTTFKLIRKYKDVQNKEYSLLEISPKTGRTHQIRVHFSYLGWPLWGDTVYGGKGDDKLGHPFLQAKRIAFRHPRIDKKLEIETDLGWDLKEVLDNLEEI